MFKEVWKSTPKWFRIIWWISATLILITLTIVLIDYNTSEEITTEGTVIDEKYQEPHDKTETGYIHTSNGNGVIVAEEHEREKFWLVVRCAEQVFKCEVDISTYYNKREHGSIVTVRRRIGAITGIPYYITAK